jgi:hypothetical protein
MASVKVREINNISCLKLNKKIISENFRKEEGERR